MVRPCNELFPPPVMSITRSNIWASISVEAAPAPWIATLLASVMTREPAVPSAAAPAAVSR